ncbi:MAG: flagellar filament capping protein FliD [Brevinematales bacterium]|nr:flagellar filament capping protein FliD [Brevinematales bacterium]
MKKIFITFLILFIFTSIFSQSQKSSGQKSSKVYVPLPGMKEKFDTEDVIQKLLYVKQLPIEKKKLEIEDYKIENEIVKDITKYLRNLDDKSKRLYDYQTPFKEMQGISPDENTIEIFASRKAKKQDYKIKINEIAKPDSFMSDSIERNKILPPSEFTIKIGKEEIKINFKGGTIYQLYEVLKNAAPDLIEVRIVNDTPTTSILVISGKQTGQENKITFSGKLDTLLNIGMLKKSDEKKFEKNIYFDNVNVISGQPVVTKNAVSMTPSSKLEKQLKEQTKEKYYLSVNVEFNIFSSEDKKEKTFFTNGNGDLVLMESVAVSNVIVGGGKLILDILEEEKPKEVITNFNDFFTINFSDGTKANYQFVSNGNYTFELPKNKEIEKIILENQNTDKEVKIANLKIFSIPDEEKFSPKNYITKASDAEFELDGVKIKRKNNNIDDVIEGVTLNLKKETDYPITVKVDYNYQKIEEAILDWVNAYNQAMEYLQIVTEPNLDRTPLHERSQENLKKGVFQAENSFISLKNKLRQVAANSYKTKYERELAVLEQIGIYTKKTGNFAANSEEWQSARMGLLNVDQEKLKSVLKSRLDGVEELFASDQDGDLVKESGVAVSANQNLRIAIGNGSFTQMRIAANDRKIQEKQKDIDELTAKLSDYELELRRKYGKMNQALSETEAKQKWLNNQFKSQQQ